MKRSRVAFLTLMIVVLLSGVGLAGGWQYSGVGARAKAMGGAYRGLSDDVAGAYYNPAGLAFLTSSYFNATGELSSPRPSITPNFNANGYGFGYLNGQERYPIDNSYLMGAGALFFKLPKNDKLVFGVAGYQGFEHNTDFNLFHINQGFNDTSVISTSNHRSNFDVITVQPTVAMKFSEDKLAIGLGLQIHRADMFMDQVKLVNSPYFYPLNVRPFEKFPKQYSINGYGYGIGVNLGIQYQLSPKVKFGASYQSQSKISIDGSSTERVFLARNQSIWDMYSDPQISEQLRKEIEETFLKGSIWTLDGNFTADLKLPSSFGAGISYQASERTIYAFDVAYTMWSQFEDFNIKIKDRNQQAPYTRWNAFLSDLKVPFGWDNSLRVSLGVEHILNKRWTVRGGYMFDQSAIPDEAFSELFLDTGAKHSLNGGASFKLNDKVTFDGALEFQAYGSRTIGEAVDRNDDGYFDNFGGEFKNRSFNSTWALNYRF